MSRFFFEKKLDGVLGDIPPTKFLSNKPNFSVVDRFSESIFREKGWTERLNFEAVKVDSIEELFGVSTILSAISASLEIASNTSFISSNQNDYADILSKSQEQFQGYFVKELEKRIGVEIPKTMKQQWQLQSPASNLKENINPLNIITSGEITAILELMFNNANTQNVDVDEYKKRIDKIFKDIWDINHDIAKTLEGYSSKLSTIENSVLENNRQNISKLSQGFKDIVRVFNDNFWVEGEENFYRQVVAVKGIIDSIITNYRKAEIQDPGVGILSDMIEEFKNHKSSLSLIITSEKKILNSIDANYSSLHPEKVSREEVSNVSFKINELFFVEDDKFEILYSLFYKNARDSYKIGGHSSVNQNATTYIKKTKTRRDVFTEVDESVPTNHSYAPKYISSGDKLAADDNTETIDASRKIGPIQDNAFEDLLDCVGDGRSYSTIGDNGNLGKYGLSARTLIDFGYVKPGTSTKNLKNENNWFSKDGISSYKNLLSNTEIQDKIIELELKRAYKKLIAANIVQKKSSIDIVGAAISTSYKFNTDAVKAILSGEDRISGNDTKSKDFFEKVKSSIDSSIPKNETTDYISAAGGNESDQLEALASSNTISDSPSLYFPPTGGASDYPYNHVKETESGHFVEMDDTPGAERIQERHRTGSGYEILPDGSRKVVVVGDGYRAVFGDDYIMVGGNVAISVFGDASIKTSGDLDICSGGDFNLNVVGNMNLNVDGDLVENISGSQISSVKGDKIENISGFNSSSTEGDVQLEGASLSIVGRETSVDIMSPEKIRMRSKDICIYGDDNVLITGDSLYIAAIEDIQMKASAYKAKTESYEVDGGNVDILSNGAINGRIKQASKAASRGFLTPIVGSVTVNDSLMDGATNYIDSGEMIDEIKLFEAFDTSKTQAFTDDEQRTLSYYSINM